MIVNWVKEDEELLEPYEWSNGDDIEIISTLSCFKVDQKTLHDFIYGCLHIFDQKLCQKVFAIGDGHYALAIETDEKGIIIYANDDFCDIAGYSKEELIGKPHSMVRHKDMPKKAFKSLWETVKSGNIWTGYVKNATKNGGYYWVFATVYPFESCDGSNGYISCRRKASTKEIADAVELYKIWNKEESK